MEKIVSEWYDSIYDVVESIKVHGVVLCGDGEWARHAVDIFALFGVVPKCICRLHEEDEFNSDIARIPHLGFSEAKEKFPFCIYISCSDTNGGRDAWNRLLKANGLLSKESGLLFWRYSFLLDTGLEIETACVSSEKPVIRSEDCDKLLVFNHMIHSGSNYFQELIDGNEYILSIPTLSSTWLKIYDNRLKKLSGKKLYMEICAQMAKYFDSSLDRKGIFPENTTLHSQDGYYGENGEFDWDIMISPVTFYFFLKSELSECRTYSFSEILKSIYSAYANSLGRTSGKSFWIAYDLHDPQTNLAELKKYGIENEFIKCAYIILIREPLQHFNSVMKAYVTNATHDLKQFMLNKARIKEYLYTDCGVYFHNTGIENVFVIRFEDLKHDCKKVMSAVSDLLEIPVSVSLNNTTLNGKVMYLKKKRGDIYEFVTGHDSSAVDKTDYVDILSEFDRERLKYLFKEFIDAYYSDYYSDIQVFSKQEMIKPYVFFNHIVDEIKKTGDVEGEANSFIETVYAEIEKLLDICHEKHAMFPMLGGECKSY